MSTTFPSETIDTLPLPRSVAPPGRAVGLNAQSQRAVFRGVPVLHVINGEHYSGAERVQDLLAARLGGWGFEVGFACLKPGLFPEMRQAKDAPLFKVPMRGRFDLTAVWPLVKIIRSKGYQIVHAHTPRTAMIGRLAAAFAGVPMVYHVHSPACRDTTHRLRNWLNSTIERLSLKGAARLIPVSESLGRHMTSEGFALERVSVVPNGVPQIDAVSDRPAPKGQWTLGTVALFRPRKGTEILLQSLAVLRREGVKVRLRAVGPFETPEYEAEVKALAGKLGLEQCIEWTGFTADVGAELEKMDLFVLPSLFGEGLPMVVLEAMAAGVPVVGTRVEGVPEAIRDGFDGAIAEPGDAEDLARAIGRITSGRLDWSELRRRVVKRHAERFSDRSMAAGIAAVYRTVLG